MPINTRPEPVPHEMPPVPQQRERTLIPQREEVDDSQAEEQPQEEKRIERFRER